MIPDYLKRLMIEENEFFSHLNSLDFVLPEYNPDTHYIEVSRKKYFQALITLRHYVKSISDYYFGIQQKAKNVDLFMLTSSVSSPMGPGSDSKALPIKFGKFDSYLVDSSQFGFEPLLMNGLEKVYCYLPSMRGEDPDKRHLNQFFHCEAEIRGTLEELIPIIEVYVKILAETFLQMPALLDKLSVNPERSKEALLNILNIQNFPQIEFDDAVKMLINHGKEDCVNQTPFGRDITNKGELALFEILNIDTPIWIRNFDRDRVAFYQKPQAANSDKVISADLLFPPLISGSFGGEIVGSGQRQDNEIEMLESMKRQNLNPEPYEWYLNLRRQPNYSTTSGFGLGVERFLAWSLCRGDIKDMIVYPRLKNLRTFP